MGDIDRLGLPEKLYKGVSAKDRSALYAALYSVGLYGDGYYLTANKTIAGKHARDMQEVLGGKTRIVQFGFQPNVYHDRLRIKKFNKIDSEWVHFIRTREFEKYDVIVSPEFTKEGYMVYLRFITNTISEKYFFDFIATTKMSPQYFFRTAIGHSTLYPTIL